MKISDMNSKELLEYIRNKNFDINNNLKEYNEYYKNKNKVFNDFLNNDHHTDLTQLRNYAYKIKNIFEHVEWAYKKQILIDSMSTNSKPKRGEIWTCQLGKNIGSEEEKIRPIIIVQNNTGNQKSPTTIIVPISNRPKKIAVHIELKKSDYDLVEGESEEITGTILCEQIRIISKARLGRHIATLKGDFVSRVLNSMLKKSIEL